jgi:hypothetical protein
MPERVSQSEADSDKDTVNPQMVRQRDRRRLRRSGRPPSANPPIARERTCEFCHQPGDHPTAADCARAVER